MLMLQAEAAAWEEEQREAQLHEQVGKPARGEHTQLAAGGLGLLDLQRLVDQVAQDLHAQALHFFGRDLAAVGADNQGKALVDIGAGDDLAVDDGRRAADVRIGLAEDHRVRGQVERAA